MAGTFDDRFAIPDEVTEAGCGRVALRVLPKALRVRRALMPGSRSLALGDCLRSRAALSTLSNRLHPQGQRIAVRLLRQAIELDPDFAFAHASFAFVRTGQFEEGWTSEPDTALAEALAAAKRAVAPDELDG